MRRTLTATALSTLMACGGSSPAPPPPPAFSITCGTYNAGEAVGLVLAAAFDPVRATATTLTVETVAGTRTVTCPAGQRHCLTAWPEVAARLEDVASWKQVRVTADVGAGSQQLTCTPSTPLLPQPSGRVAVSGSVVTATWDAVPGAAGYRATLRDLGPPGVAPARILESLTTTATQATFTLSAATPELAVVEVEAWAADPAAPPAGALPAGGANRSMRALPFGAAPWSLKLPSDFTGTTLTLPVPAGQRLAITLLNIGGPEGSYTSISTAGTGPAAGAPPARGMARFAGGAGAAAGNLASWGHLPFQLRAPALPLLNRHGAGAVAATAPTTTFCTPRFDVAMSFLGNTRRPATLARETASGLLYVDDANAGEFTEADWDTMASAWEAVQAVVTGLTGPPPDVDGNGKIIVFFTSQLGPSIGGFTGANDRPLDTTPLCTGTGSNQADLFTVHSPAGGLRSDGTPLPPSDVLGYLPSFLAHELQHVVDGRRFASEMPGGSWGEQWLIEGRAELATTLAGRGQHRAYDRSFRVDLFRRTGPDGGYPGLRIRPWEQKNINYLGSGLFLLYLSDRLGPAFSPPFFQEATSLAQLEAVSGLPFPVAYGLWTSALLFSNEPANPWPVLDYSGPDWTPLHQKYQRFEYGLLSAGAAVPVPLRRNGFDVFVTGVADAGGGTVTITSRAGVKPHMVVVPFTGSLP